MVSSAQLLTGQPHRPRFSPQQFRELVGPGYQVGIVGEGVLGMASAPYYQDRNRAKLGRQQKFPKTPNHKRRMILRLLGQAQRREALHQPFEGDGNFLPC